MITNTGGAIPHEVTLEILDSFQTAFEGILDETIDIEDYYATLIHALVGIKETLTSLTEDGSITNDYKEEFLKVSLQRILNLCLKNLFDKNH